MKYLMFLLVLASPVLADAPPGACNCGKVCTGARCFMLPACGQGLCYAWKDSVDENGSPTASLFYLGKHVGSYRYADGVYLPLSGDVWGKPCDPPTPPPKRPQVILAQPQTYSAPVRVVASC